MLDQEKLLREFISIILEKDDVSSGDTSQQNDDITFKDLRGFFANTQKKQKIKEVY
jgi:hypothetical protein